MTRDEWLEAGFDEVYELAPGRCYLVVYKGWTFRILILETIVGPLRWSADIDEAVTPNIAAASPEEKLSGLLAALDDDDASHKRASATPTARETWGRLFDRPRTADKATSAEQALRYAVNDLLQLLSDREFQGR